MILAWCSWLRYLAKSIYLVTLRHSKQKSLSLVARAKQNIGAAAPDFFTTVTLTTQTKFICNIYLRNKKNPGNLSRNGFHPAWVLESTFHQLDISKQSVTKKKSYCFLICCTKKLTTCKSVTSDRNYDIYFIMPNQVILYFLVGLFP